MTLFRVLESLWADFVLHDIHLCILWYGTSPNDSNGSSITCLWSQSQSLLMDGSIVEGARARAQKTVISSQKRKAKCGLPILDRWRLGIGFRELRKFAKACDIMLTAAARHRIWGSFATLVQPTLQRWEVLERIDAWAMIET